MPRTPQQAATCRSSANQPRPIIPAARRHHIRIPRLAQRPQHEPARIWRRSPHRIRQNVKIARRNFHPTRPQPLTPKPVIARQLEHVAQRANRTHPRIRQPINIMTPRRPRRVTPLARRLAHNPARRHRRPKWLTIGVRDPGAIQNDTVRDAHLIERRPRTPRHLHASRRHQLTGTIKWLHHEPIANGQ